MRKLWDFHGGIHPPENKTQSNQSPIRPIPVPQTLVLPLAQHIGAPAVPVVSAGQQVKKGQLLAEPKGRISAGVHAPTSGTIKEIVSRPVLHPSGMSDQCLILESDGKDEWLGPGTRRNPDLLTGDQILSIIREKGLAGMGGAGFPTEVKLHPPKEDKVQILIINGAECEPYITADDRLMQEEARRIVSGINLMAKALEPGEVVVAIEDNKPAAIQAMREAVAGTRIEIVVIPTKYPSGGEKQLIKILTGREVPKGHIPADIGVMCQNVGTAAAVHDAVVEDTPLISRVVTVTGQAVKHPGNYRVLIGTPVQFVLEQAGLYPYRMEQLVVGGPMMGFRAPQLSAPVVKTTNCLIAAAPGELAAPEDEQPCIRCGFCVEACPMDLLPQQLFWFARNKEFDKAELFNLQDCIECGACSYVCPSQIPLVQYYRFAKGEIRQLKEDKLKSDRARLRFESRMARLEREAAEKEAQRKARAAAAAKAQAAKRAAAGKAPAPETSPEAGKAEGAVDKKAAIAAAIQRANEKKANSPEAASPPVSNEDIQKLESDLKKAEAKLDKMKQAAQDLDPSDKAAHEKMTRAIAKNEKRVEAAQRALTEAKQKRSDGSPSDTSDLTGKAPTHSPAN